MANINISFTNSQLKQQAEQTAQRLDLPIIEYSNENPADYCLLFSNDGISLISNSNKHGAIRCDFIGGSNRHRRNFGGGNGQMIAKAVGVSGKFHPNLLDLTAGLGVDAFVLASLGCEIKLFERNPIVHTLLQDGLNRALIAAEGDPTLQSIIARMELLQTDSSTYLDSINQDMPDIIYLDPMFPPRKKSAQVKKEMQVLHQIVGSDEDAGDLLEKALCKTKYRVIVKRPAHSDFLGGQKPSYSLKGKSTRYDIFALQKLPK